MEKDLQIILSDITEFVTQNYWIFEIAIIAIVGFFINYISSRAIKKLQKKLSRARHFWKVIFFKFPT